MICWKCGKENKLDFVARTAECDSCHADLHCCKGCKFYSKNSHYDCKESIVDPVADKEKSNFCEFFMAKTENSFTTEESKSDVKAAAFALFGEAPKNSNNDSDSAKKAFNSLFGD